MTIIRKPNCDAGAASRRHNRSNTSPGGTGRASSGKSPSYSSYLYNHWWRRDGKRYHGGRRQPVMGGWQRLRYCWIVKNDQRNTLRTTFVPQWPHCRGTRSKVGLVLLVKSISWCWFGDDQQLLSKTAEAVLRDLRQIPGPGKHHFQRGAYP